jgi:hypothetical protein
MKVIEKMRAVSLDVVAPVLIVLIGATLPWGRSGAADRSSFELVRLARRLDVLDGGAATAAKAWLAAPLVVAVVVVAGATGRRTLAALTGTVLVVVAVGLVAATYRSPLLPRYGLHVTMAGAGALAVAGMANAVRRGRAAPDTDRARSDPSA